MIETTDQILATIQLGGSRGAVGGERGEILGALQASMRDLQQLCEGTIKLKYKPTKVTATAVADPAADGSATEEQSAFVDKIILK